MIENIYMPMMVITDPYGSYFSSAIINKIIHCQTPNGITIRDVRRGFDPAIDYVFDLVKRHNPPDVYDPRFQYEEDNYLRIEVEVSESIKYQRLNWLEELIKEAVRKHDFPVGIYFSYLISDSEFFISNALKIFIRDGQKVIEDDDSDDFSDLQEYSSFFNHCWYLMDEIPLEDVYPVLTSKFLLLFG